MGELRAGHARVVELSKLLFGPVFLFLALLDHQLIAFELPVRHPVDHGFLAGLVHGDNHVRVALVAVVAAGYRLSRWRSLRVSRSSR